MKKHDLRKKFGNITGKKVRTERIIIYNVEYIEWLEQENIGLIEKLQKK